MRRLFTWPCAACVTASIILLSGQAPCRAEDGPATRPAAQIKTGVLDLTFTERSPQSDSKELARRLNLKQADMGADYDLSKRPFKAYVPRNYDPAQPVGVIVYLGYKDSVSSPPLWQAVLEESHLIFIAPVSHSGTQYPGSVPLWQTTGLALDAVYNLKRQYAIDDKRIYEMSWALGSTQTALATADVFRGFILTYDQSWFEPVRAENGGYYPATFSSPPVALLLKAQNLPFFLIDDKSGELAKEISLKVGAMRHDGFEHVIQTGLSNTDDLHFPNLKAEWFSQQALPFLDKSSTAERKLNPESRMAAANSETAGATTAPTASAGPSEAQSLLSQAQLLMSNDRTELARDKLQKIVELFPNDPAAAKAKQLLDQIGGP